MARIRTIKPEFWTSEKVMECCRDARLLFIGLWNFADDGGVHPASTKTLKARIFPADDDITSENVQRLLDELSSNGLITKYLVTGSCSYIRIVGWAHQRIDQPTFKYPDETGAIPTSVRRTSAERSPPDTDTEGKGRERKKKDVAPVALPVWLDLAAWGRWEQFRKEIKQPLTPTTIEVNLRVLDKDQAHQAEIIDQSINARWRGLFELKDHHGNPGKSGGQSAPERVRAANKDLQ